MKLIFDPNQAHQRAAVDAVLDRFADVEPAADRRTTVGSHAVVRNVLPRDHERLVVEMETGTGKTYVFVRTALELAERLALRKFVVVVPSVAIREMVLKTLQVTREHFAAVYPSLPVRFFAYDAARISEVVRFARSDAVEFLVVTIDAFNKATNVLRQQTDRLGGATGLELLRATRPVLIVDEPHRFTSALRRQAQDDLDPALTLGYGATPGDFGETIHRLTPAQAHRDGLVKTIEVVGPPGENDVARMSAQIRETIATHMRRQSELASRGIKVLSLFFVERVAHYAGPEPIVRDLFDQHFEELKHEFPRFADTPAPQVRSAYFAQARRRGGIEPTDSRTGESKADADAYRLIMRDKERLLGFEEPVAFVFSHSALREGWDNPNVFVVCTLARSHSARKKRQEIGRGVRLCVDQSGQRVLDRDVNRLRVVANESYEQYVATLQSEEAQWIDDPSERAPAPTDGRMTRPARVPRQQRLPLPPPVEPGGWAAVVRTRLASWSPAAAGGSAPMPNLVDLVATALRRRATVVPTRATILDLIEAVPERDALLAPHELAEAIADAITTA